MMRRKAFLVSAVVIAGLVFAFAGCSDAGNDPEDYADFSPPSWIIGTWQDSSDTVSYTFTSDNITMDSSSTSINFKEAYKEANVSENITDSLYEATVEGEGISAVYKFEKTSSTTVDHSITTGGGYYRSS